MPLLEPKGFQTPIGPPNVLTLPIEDQKLYRWSYGPNLGSVDGLVVQCGLGHRGDGVGIVGEWGGAGGRNRQERPQWAPEREAFQWMKERMSCILMQLGVSIVTICVGITGTLD
ncbi:UNVERIFIED_CONTAM: hypothetical protein Sradi_4553700 [Sesamum radiatum]|uniref:Uncharacterized protein n=1 Tax=Sesamum radiatum TaxID=300843 RepID=A0AAW2N9Z4_SESRA